LTNFFELNVQNASMLIDLICYY